MSHRDTKKGLRAALNEKTQFDENTLFKVFVALRSVGLDISTATEAVDAMQNAGILFRERV